MRWLSGITLLLALILTTPILCQAQATLTFEWDAVTKDVNGNTITGDVNYNFYVCSDQALTSCQTPVQVMEGVQYSRQFNDGTYYVAVKAWIYAIVDPDTGLPLTDDQLQSPGFSNVVPFKVQVPPGNTANTKVRLIAVP